MPVERDRFIRRRSVNDSALIEDDRTRRRVEIKGLTREQVTDIAQLMIDDVNRRVSDKCISVVLTDAAMDKVIGEAYSPEFGARPLRRYIQRNIETLLAKALLKGDISQDETAVIDANETGLFVARTARE